MKTTFKTFVTSTALSLLVMQAPAIASDISEEEQQRSPTKLVNKDWYFGGGAVNPVNWFAPYRNKQVDTYKGEVATLLNPTVLHMKYPQLPLTFNPDLWLSLNEDIANTAKSLNESEDPENWVIQHFLSTSRFKQDRRMVPKDFDASVYLDVNPALAKVIETYPEDQRIGLATLHYVRFGFAKKLEYK